MGFFSLRYLFYQFQLKWRLSFYVAALEKVTVTLFDCYLNADYPSYCYLYEKRIHDAKSAAILASVQTETIIKKLSSNPSRITHFVTRKRQCDDLFLLLIDSGQLRHRVNDHATFRFCADEMSQIKLYLLEQFNHLKQSVLKETGSILHEESDTLLNLEGVYEMVLQVVAKEPINFLLFIQDIKQLSERLMNVKVQ